MVEGEDVQIRMNASKDVVGDQDQQPVVEGEEEK